MWCIVGRGLLLFGDVDVRWVEWPAVAARRGLNR
jgi:hypothetical protein